MSPRALLSAIGVIGALLLVSAGFVWIGCSLVEAWLLASLVVGGFLLVVVAPLMESSAKREDARALALNKLALWWRLSARELRSEVERGVALRQSPESKLARADVLESCAAGVERLLRGEETAEEES